MARRWLAASTRKAQYVWDTATWTERTIPLASEDGRRGSVEFSPDSRILLTSYAGSTRRLIDIETLEVIAVLESPDYVRGSSRFTPSGDAIVSAAMDGYRVWDLAALREELAEMKLDWE